MSHPVTATTAKNVTKALELVAAGQTYAQVAKTLHISVRSVQRILSEPLVKQALADLRLVHRVQSIDRARVITPKVYDLLEHAVDAGDYKGTDYAARAALSLEKVGASASGENRPLAQPTQQVVVTVAPGWVKPKPGEATMTSVTSAPAPAHPVIPKELLPAPKPIPRDL
jgi:hypothetical protein